MGLYDRDYSRPEHDDRRLGVSVADWSGITWLIVANVVVFVLWLGALDNEAFYEWMSANFTASATGVLVEWRIHTLLTSIFSHMEAWHLLFNMLFLYWCGKVLEDDIYGARDITVLYLVTGLTGSLVYILMPLVGLTVDHPALGASGAVMGIVVCCACFFPSRPVHFMMLIPMELRYLAILYVGMDLLMLLTRSDTGIGHAAHLGGALAGYLFFKYDLRIFRDRATRSAATRAQSRRRSLWGRLGSLFQRRPRMTVIEGGKGRGRAPLDDTMPERKVDAETGRRVDDLLAKISREGQSALTDEEREFLAEASRKYKR